MFLEERARIAVHSAPGSHKGIHTMETLRQEIMRRLEAAALTAGEISRALGIREREVLEHLPHVARSLATRGKRLEVVPFRCISCGHVFESRKRFTRPGRCPRCRKTRIEKPRFRVIKDR